MKNKEKAVIIKNTNNIKDNYDIIYLGSFFCSKLIPKPQDIDMFYNNKKISIMTPYMTQKELDESKSKISKLLYNYKNIEILINDFGLLELLNRQYPSIKKGVAIPLSYDIIRMKEDKIKMFMKKYKLDILETDEDYFLNRLKNREFKISFHYPLKFLGSSRFCPHIRNILSYKCSFECLNNKIITLTHYKTKKNLYIYHSGYFILKNEICNNNYDRIVINYENNNKSQS